MPNLLRHRLIVLLLLLSSFSFVSSSPILASEKTDSSIIVDFVSGTVGGVKIRGNIADITKAIGAQRISKSIEYLEGQPSDLYIISFDNHKISHHGYAFSYTDPIFKTKEGLGIGSKVKDFNRFYGQGRVSMEEGFAIYYKTDSVQIAVTTKFIDGKKQHINLYTNSIVDDIWVW
jgi:hypothetical protein